MRLLNPLKLALPVLALGLLGIPLYGQSQQRPARPGAGAEPEQQQQQQSQDTMLTGKIVKSGNELMLKDTATNTSYKIENADQVKQYVGKDVRVMATVDTATNSIRISRIGVMSQPPSK